MADNKELESRIAEVETSLAIAEQTATQGYMTAPMFGGGELIGDISGTNLAFQVYIKSNTVVTVNPGGGYIARNKAIKIPTAYTTTDVIVSGAGWVYLRVAKSDPSNNAFAFLAGSALPNAQSASDWNFPIAELEVVDGNIQIVEPQFHKGALLDIGAAM